VVGVGAGDDHAIRLQLLEHLVEVGRKIFPRLGAVGCNELRRHLEPARIGVANADQLVAVLEGGGDGREVHARTRAHANVYVLAPSSGGLRDGGQAHGGGSGGLEHGAPVELQITHLYVPHEVLAFGLPAERYRKYDQKRSRTSRRSVS
jgi:hypothetical protein